MNEMDDPLLDIGSIIDTSSQDNPRASDPNYTSPGVVTPVSSGPSSAEKAAIFGSEGYGEGMTGEQTDVYDKAISLFGNKDIAGLLTNLFGNKLGSQLFTPSGLLTGLAALYMLRGGNKSTPASVGYKGSIPKYTATSAPATLPAPRAYGAPAMGQQMLGDVTYAADGGIMAAKGRYLQGSTDGMADKINTSIDGNQPAKLSHGEFVVPADVVSHLGNGNSDAGADVLYKMMDRVRKARTGTVKQGKRINPEKFTPGGQAYGGGGPVAFADGGDASSKAAVSSALSGTPVSTSSNLSEWAGPYVTEMLGRAQALSQLPYQPYQGQLTAGTSPLQQQAFSALSALMGGRGGYGGGYGQPQMRAMQQPVQFDEGTGGGFPTDRVMQMMGEPAVTGPLPQDGSAIPQFGGRMRQGLGGMGGMGGGAPGYPSQFDTATRFATQAGERAGQMQYTPSQFTMGQVNAPEITRYQMDQPKDVPGVEAKAAQLGQTPMYEGQQFGAPGEVGMERVGAERVSALPLQQLRMDPARDINAPNLGATPLMQAQTTGYAPQLQQYRMEAQPQVTTQSFAQPGAAESYMSPYMQDVVSRQQQAAQREADIAAQTQKAQFAQAGAFGGGRQGVAQARAAEALARQKGDIQAQGLQSAYQQAQQQFNVQQQAAMQAALANQQAGLTVGQQNLAAQQEIGRAHV